MKRLILLTLLGLSACNPFPPASQASAMDPPPLPMEPIVQTSNSDIKDFSVSIFAPKQIKSNEEFTVEAALTNLTDESYKIQHASGIFYFSIKDNNGKVMNSFVMPMKGVMRSLNGKATIAEQYTYKLEKPGLYEVFATGKFMIGEGEQQKAYELETPMAQIEVIQ